MTSWKKWGAIVALLAANSLLSCAEPTDREVWNYHDTPTDGGRYTNDSCSNIEAYYPFCHRDGDKNYYQCNSSGQMSAMTCATEQWCYGARDTQEARCIPESRFGHDGVPEGVEPGSRLWELKRAELKNAGTPGNSCCKVCTSSKACGDSCISKSKTCNVGRGCACNG